MRLEKLRKCTSRTKTYYNDSHMEKTNLNKQKIWPVIAKHKHKHNIHIIVRCEIWECLPHC